MSDCWCGECPICGNDMYCEEDGSNATCYVCLGNQVEVIGNIYEQPDSTDRTRKTYTILG